MVLSKVAASGLSAILRSSAFCLRHTGLDRGLEVLVLDFVEGWRLKGQCAGRVKRIGWTEVRGRSESLVHEAERDGAGRYQCGRHQGTKE